MQNIKFSKENESGAYVRSNLTIIDCNLNTKLKSLINFDDPHDMKVNNLIQLFEIGKSIVGETANCFGYRRNDDSPYEWISYGEFHNLFTNCAKGLCHIGIDIGNNVNIATYGKMSIETFTVIFAALRRQNVIVPMYDSLGKTSIEHIINEVSPVLAYCDNETRANILLEVKDCKISYILTPFPPSLEFKSKAEEFSVKLIKLDDLTKLGANSEIELPDPTLDDLMYILYTSGSLGIPKGVMLYHRQFVFNIITLIRTLGCETKSIDINGIVYYSYLPYQHSFESLVLFFMLTIGAQVGISQGNLKLIPSDLKALSPTLMIAVPRVLERFKEKILDSVSQSNPISQFIFNWAFDKRKNQLIDTNNLPYSMFYNIIFNRIHSNFGGNLQHIIVGGAPMSRDIEIFSRVLFGVNLIHGYGLTETTAPTMVQSNGNCGLGEVGGPMYGIEAKLVDAPDYDYFTKDGYGELCMRGPNITPGYYKRPDLNKEAFDDDGFFHTGDIAKINENGTFTIIDRCKNIFKLNQGEYIIPEKIEIVYSKHPLVKQILIYGESTQSYCIAVIIVDDAKFDEFVKSLSLPGDSDNFFENKEVKAKLISELNSLGKNAGLFGFEQVKAIVLDNVEFTISNELLTPTMKIRRPIVIKKYMNQFRDLYR